ncbi:MAG: hypothetical protein IJ184_05080 [Alphaproteobacteria bacterium]|nr:hypothetical protein [Alphaproteobacteria bacterium]
MAKEVRINGMTGKKVQVEKQRTMPFVRKAAKWLADASGMDYNYKKNQSYYPSMVDESELKTKSLCKSTPDLVLVVSHDAKLLAKTAETLPDVPMVFVTQQDYDDEILADAVYKRLVATLVVESYRPLDLVEAAKELLNLRYTKKAGWQGKPNIAVFADFPVLAAQILADECPQCELYFAKHKFSPSNELRIDLTVSALLSSMLLNKCNRGLNLGTLLLDRPSLLGADEIISKHCGCVHPYTLEALGYARLFIEPRVRERRVQMGIVLTK